MEWNSVLLPIVTPATKNQCFGSGFNQVRGSGIRIRIQDPQNKIKEISCFEVLEVLFLGLKHFPVARTSFMEPRDK
jgi:hypothetical protein